MRKVIPARPTAMRAAFEGCFVNPSAIEKRDLLKRVALAVRSRMGYRKMIQRGRTYADGPRPASAGPVTMFNDGAHE